MFAMSYPKLQCHILTSLFRHVFESYYRDVLSNSIFHGSCYKTKIILLLLLLVVYLCFILTLAGKAFALTLAFCLKGPTVGYLFWPVEFHHNRHKIFSQLALFPIFFIFPPKYAAFVGFSKKLFFSSCFSSSSFYVSSKKSCCC